MAEYKSAYTGEQIDSAVQKALATTPITEGGTGATTAEQALNNLGAMAKWDLLWANASPSSSITTQTVTISNLSSYNSFVIFFDVTTTNDDRMSAIGYRENTDDTLIMSLSSVTIGSSGPYGRDRNCTISSNTVSFGACTGGYTSSISEPKGNIPVYIFGANI